jgi:hypothetical protein
LGILKEAIVDMFRTVAGLFGAACRERLSVDKALRLLAAMGEKDEGDGRSLIQLPMNRVRLQTVYVKHR